MKKYILPILMLSALVSCERAERCAGVTETLFVDGMASTRVRLSEEIHSVWETGDEVSVFLNGGANERWSYTGTDGASSGTLSYVSDNYRFGAIDRIVAVWPYDAGMSISANVVSLNFPAAQAYRSGSFGSAVICAVSTDDRLFFKYANAFVRLALRGSGSVAALSLSGNTDETLAGAALLDASGLDPVLSLAPAASAKTISLSLAAPVALSRGSDTYFYFALPPMSFASGFSIHVQMSNGDETVVRHSFPDETLAAGEVLCIDGESNETYVFTIDFSKNEFTPAFSTSSSKDSTKVFHHNSGYDFTFTPRRTASEKASNTTWGYSWRSNAGGELVFGRGGSFFPLPNLPGKILMGVWYYPGSTGGGPHLTDNTVTQEKVSNQVGTTVAGESYWIGVNNPVADHQYFFTVNGGNVVIRKLELCFIDE